MAETKDMLKEDYGVHVNKTTTRNPQANAILERIHQTIGNMIRTMRLYDNPNIDKEDPFSGILSAVAFATRATVHTTLGATPSQLVFGRDAILNTKFEADWALIRARKQKLIDQNNQHENKKRKPHAYQVNDKILIANDPNRKFGQDPFSGPFVIQKVNDNGTVRYQDGSKIDTVNIRNIKPFKS